MATPLFNIDRNLKKFLNPLYAYLSFLRQEDNQPLLQKVTVNQRDTNNRNYFIISFSNTDSIIRPWQDFICTDSHLSIDKNYRKNASQKVFGASAAHFTLNMKNPYTEETLIGHLYFEYDGSIIHPLITTVSPDGLKNTLETKENDEIYQLLTQYAVQSRNFVTELNCAREEHLTNLKKQASEILKQMCSLRTLFHEETLRQFETYHTQFSSLIFDINRFSPNHSGTDQRDKPQKQVILFAKEQIRLQKRKAALQKNTLPQNPNDDSGNPECKLEEEYKTLEANSNAQRANLFSTLLEQALALLPHEEDTLESLIAKSQKIHTANQMILCCYCFQDLTRQEKETIQKVEHYIQKLKDCLLSRYTNAIFNDVLETVKKIHPVLEDNPEQTLKIYIAKLQSLKKLLCEKENQEERKQEAPAHNTEIAEKICFYLKKNSASFRDACASIMAHSKAFSDLTFSISFLAQLAVKKNDHAFRFFWKLQDDTKYIGITQNKWSHPLIKKLIFLKKTDLALYLLNNGVSFSGLSSQVDSLGEPTASPDTLEGKKQRKFLRQMRQYSNKTRQMALQLSRPKNRQPTRLNQEQKKQLDVMEESLDLPSCLATAYYSHNSIEEINRLMPYSDLSDLVLSLACLTTQKGVCMGFRPGFPSGVFYFSSKHLQRKETNTLPKRGPREGENAVFLYPAENKENFRSAKMLETFFQRYNEQVSTFPIEIVQKTNSKLLWYAQTLKAKPKPKKASRPAAELCVLACLFLNFSLLQRADQQNLPEKNKLYQEQNNLLEMLLYIAQQNRDPIDQVNQIMLSKARANLPIHKKEAIPVFSEKAASLAKALTQNLTPENLELWGHLVQAGLRKGTQRRFPLLFNSSAPSRQMNNEEVKNSEENQRKNSCAQPVTAVIEPEKMNAEKDTGGNKKKRKKKKKRRRKKPK